VAPTPSQQEQEIIEILKSLESVKAEYPPELLAARRAAFIGQIIQRGGASAKEALELEDQETIKLLEVLQSVKSEYPPELLTARRAAFIGQITQRSGVDVKEDLNSEDRDMIKLLEGLQSVKAEYPPKLLAARRSAFIGQIVKRNRVAWMEALRSAIQNTLINYKAKFQPALVMKTIYASLVIAVMIFAAFASSLMYRARDQLKEVSHLILISVTNTPEASQTMCKPGYLPPLCLAKAIDTTQNLSFQGNGLARAAVAKDTLPGLSGINQAAFANDGLYGSGSSWISNSAYSWIKIDLGQTTVINTVAFGRDRLGNFSDRNPGQFTIAVALSDNVYANGDSSSDNSEYKEVYDSESAGFTGTDSGAETVRAYFGSVMARYVKITFTNPGTAIDEVEVFLFNPSPTLSVAQIRATRLKREPRDTATSVPSYTPLPTDTSTPVPTDTPTPIPTNTPQPTDTATPVPTSTSTPIPTDTPQPTATAVPIDTSPPNNTPTSVPTDTLTVMPTP